MKSYVRMPNGTIYHCENDQPISNDVKFDNNSILLIWDSIADEDLNSIIQIRNMPKYVVSESYSFLKVPGIKTYTVAKWIESEVDKCIPNMKSIDQVHTTHSASFCVNKKQTNRHLLIKFCEIFNITANYTWSGIGKTFDMLEVINEKQQLNDDVIDRYFPELLSPIAIDKKWTGQGTLHENNSAVLDYGTNDKSWNNGLFDIISNSAVHLISESIISNNDACHFTEKTMYAVQGLAFPIWIGGKNQAAEWQKYGFDIFEDIIDHSYQNYSTLLERCFYAFYLNLELLQNPDKAAQLRESNVQRLRKNQELLTRQTFKKYHDSVVSSWPSDLQKEIIPLFKKYTIE